MIKYTLHWSIVFIFLFPFVNISQTFSQDYLNTAKRIGLDPIYAPFYHGVASGDPLPEKVIIWTRVTPDTNITGSIKVCWRIALDTNFSQVVNSGITYTTDSVDYTVKVDVGGLEPNTWYYYEFNALGKNSLIGRTKTAPVGDVDSIRFAVVSCAHFEHGFYNAYERIVNRNDIDAVLHLGDYIYEYAAGGGYTTDTVRKHDPENEILTLADYRIRYSQYHLDPLLRSLHQQYPWIIVWDDHETANNSWIGGADNHDTITEGSWEDRKAAGIQAHHEWLPIRLPDPNSYERIYRKFSFGNLLDLIMLDTRLEARVEQVSGSLIPNTNAQLNDTNRTLLGAEQYQWLINKLDSSNAQWKILGQQVMIAPMELDILFIRYVLNTDQWDGYRAERGKLLNTIMNNNINNVVVLTGDIHTSWANDIPLDVDTYDPGTGAGSVGVEFVTTSVTSSASIFDFLGNFGSTALVKSNNPHIKYVDLANKGYLIVDINKTRTQADWYYVTTVDSLLFEDNYAESWYVNDQERFLNPSGSASQKLSPLQLQAPLLPNNQYVPQANDDIVFTDIGATVVIDVQNNDAYPNCSVLITSIISGPSNGIANVLNSDSIEYTPDLGFTGTDTIIYVVCDSSAPSVCDTAMVLIAVNSPIAIDELSAKKNDIVLFGIYPNPFTGNILLQYYVYQSTDVQIRLIDISGKVVLVKNFDKTQEGLYEAVINCEGISAGTYMLLLETENQVRKRKVIKN